MAVLVCPSCRAKFTSSGSGRATCPTCGERFGGGSAASRTRDDDRPVRKAPRRRRDDDEDDDDYDDRPVRRRKKSSGGSGVLLYILLGSGILTLLGVFGACLAAVIMADTVEEDEGRPAMAANMPAGNRQPGGGVQQSQPEVREQEAPAGLGRPSEEAEPEKGRAPEGPRKGMVPPNSGPPNFGPPGGGIPQPQPFGTAPAGPPAGTVPPFGAGPPSNRNPGGLPVPNNQGLRGQGPGNPGGNALPQPPGMAQPPGAGQPPAFGPPRGLGPPPGVGQPPAFGPPGVDGPAAPGVPPGQSPALPGRGPGDGKPGMQNPGAPPGAGPGGLPPGGFNPGATMPVTLTNLRRNTGFNNELAVDFEYTEGEKQAKDVVLVRINGTRIVQVSLTGTGNKKGTVKLGKLNGRIEVMMVRGYNAQTRTPGPQISNVMTLN